MKRKSLFYHEEGIYVHATAHMLRPAEAGGRPVGGSSLFPFGESLGLNSVVSSAAGTFITETSCVAQNYQRGGMGWEGMACLWRWEDNFVESTVSIHLWVGSGPGLPNKPSHPPFYEFEVSPLS